MKQQSPLREKQIRIRMDGLSNLGESCIDVLHPLGIWAWAQDTACGWEIVLVNGLPNFAQLVDEVLQIPCGL